MSISLGMLAYCGQRGSNREKGTSPLPPKSHPFWRSADMVEQIGKAFAGIEEEKARIASPSALHRPLA